MEQVMDYLPFLIPIIIADVGLSIFALVHVLKHPHYRVGNKVIWSVIVLLIQLFGPIIYFVFGRGEE